MSPHLRLARLATTALCVVALSQACGDERPPPAPARFDRPNAVAFVCVLDGEAVQLDHCRNDVTGNALALHALVTQSARGEVAAINLETQRVIDNRRDIPGFTFVPVGEMPVAVVVPRRNARFTYVADFGSRDVRVLQTNALVAPLAGDPLLQRVRIAIDAAGEVVVLSPDDPALAADGLQVVAPTDMALSPDESGLVVAAPDVGRVLWLPIQRCVASSADCREGLIDTSAGAVRAIPLEASRDRLVTSESETPAPAAQYEALCGFERDALPPTALPPAPAESVMTTTPRPIALAVDSDCPDGTDCAARVFVADDALPIIHALDLDALATGGDDASVVQEPWWSGVPTRSLVVTPWVPATVAAPLEADDLPVPDGPDDGGEAQYVYAIDDSDGSVLVLENGRVLNVNAGVTGRPDRIALQTEAAATALAIVTPAFDPSEAEEQWLAPPGACLETQDPRFLRGVFLAAALSDGSVRIVDVHDMELRSCRECPRGHIPVLVRHQPRLNVNFLTEAGDDAPSIAPVAATLFRAGGLAFAVRSDGSTGSPEAPGLECIRCAEELVRAFPPETDTLGEEPVVAPPAGMTDGDAGTVIDAGLGDAAVGTVDEPAVSQACGGAAPALVCADPDPWASGETWTAVLEGLIPGTGGHVGTLIPEGSADSQTGALEFEPETDFDFCSAGVLGEDDIAATFSDQECDSAVSADRPNGDQLVIITPPLSAERAAALYPDDEETGIRERCQEIRDALQQDNATPVGFEIRRAYSDRLVLSSRLAHEVASVSSYAGIAPCLERGLLAFDVRTLNQLAVRGALTGFLHNVRANASGRCVVDPEGDPLRQSRARLGCTYRNANVQFRIHKPGAGELQPPPRLEFQVQPRSPAEKMAVSATGGFSVTVVGVQMRFNPIDGRLYLVDVHGRGLMPLALDPLPSVAPQSFN